jgi:transposase
MCAVIFVGIDLHKDSLTICIMTREGTVEFVTLPTRCKQKIAAFFKDLARKYRVHAAVESVGFYHWFWDLVEPLVDELLLADASQVRAAAGRKAKTDRNDAHTLARLLRDDSLPTAFAPDAELRGQRNLARHRARLQRRLSSCKSSLRMEMSKLGLPGPRELTSGTLHKWFAAQFKKIPESTRWAIEDLQEQLALYEKQLRRIDERLERLCAEEERVRQSVARYTTLPGIGTLTAFTLYTETGGLDRFDTAGEIVCYAGLAPRTFQSGESCRHGRIDKSGPPILRKYLINAAWTAVRSAPAIKRKFEKWKRTSGRKKAIVKLAAKLLVWAWAMEKNGTDFEIGKVAA